MEEVDALNRQILAHEKKEEAVADKMLDTEWKKVEKKIKKWYNQGMDKKSSLTIQQKIMVLAEFNRLLKERIAASQKQK